LLTGKKATASCFFSVTQSRNGMCFTRQQAAPALPPEYTTKLSYRLFQGVCEVWHFPSGIKGPVTAGLVKAKGHFARATFPPASGIEIPVASANL
jgi:hypothetical protein